jgi:hypothetical protein
MRTEMNPCPHCQRPRPDEVITDGRCDWCHMEAQRELDAAAFAAWQADESWDGPLGNALRQRRNQELDRTSWMIRPDSPLSTGCIAAVTAWRRQLHRMTIDHPAPAGVEVPPCPALQYEEISDGDEAQD